MYKQLRIREVSKNKMLKRTYEWRKIERRFLKVLHSFGRRARVEQRAISKEEWIFFPAGPGPAFSPKIRLIGSLQPLRSETPESVRSNSELLNCNKEELKDRGGWRGQGKGAD